MKHKQIHLHSEIATSLDELRLIVWFIQSLFLIGPRACGKSTILEILNLLAGPFIYTGDSSDNISCESPKKRGGLVQVFPDSFEARQLQASADSRASGGLMNSDAALVANVVMTSRDLHRFPQTMRVVLAGTIRDPNQARQFKQLLHRFKTVVIHSSFKETVIGSYARMERNQEARLDITPTSIVKAWLVFNGPIKDAVRYLDMEIGPTSIVQLNKSSDPLEKMQLVVKALGVQGLQDHWLKCLESEKHAAGRRILTLRKEIAEEEGGLRKRAQPFVEQCERALDEHMKQASRHPATDASIMQGLGAAASPSQPATFMSA